MAEEVRKLAEESQGAAGQIAGLIGEIQVETEKVVGVVAEGARRTEDGAATVERARKAFQRIGERRRGHGAAASARSPPWSSQIASGAGRSRHGIGEVAAGRRAVLGLTEQVSASAEETSASTQEIAASAESLAHTAEELDALVRRFKVEAP